MVETAFLSLTREAKVDIMKKYQVFSKYHDFLKNGLYNIWYYGAKLRNFQKSQRTIVVLRLIWGMIGFCYVFEPYPRLLIFVRGKRPKLGKNGLFFTKKQSAYCE